MIRDCRGSDCAKNAPKGRPTRRRQGLPRLWRRCAPIAPKYWRIASRMRSRPIPTASPRCMSRSTTSWSIIRNSALMRRPSSSCKPSPRRPASRASARRCSPANCSTPPKDAPLCTRRCVISRAASVIGEGRDVMPEIEAERARVAAFASDVREGRLRGALGQPMTDVVNIGIGGSDLGPAMATKALGPFAPINLRSHFVSNVDGADIADSLRGLDPARTLFIVSSKTFTTQETMTNGASARAWISGALGEAAFADHCAAVSTQLDKVAQFGIAAERVFGFWDWVGGRYSIWSSIGLPLAIAIGPERFEEFLRGGYEVDCHFRDAPIVQNIPMLMGLLSVWNRNILGHASQAVIPYDQRLSRFPAYLQQLQMESNGKSVQREGIPAKEATGAVIWGEPGTNGQHAFFQLIHQGTEIIQVDFLVAAQPTNADAHHHDLL